MATTLLEATGRWLVYLPALALFGTLGLLHIARPGSADADLPALRSWGRWLALALLAAILLRALLQTVAVFGLGELELESLRRVAVDSRWGGRWRWQALAAVAILSGTWLGLHRRAGRIVTGLSLLGMAAALPALGHAWGDPVQWIAQSAHIVGAGLWIGTLLLLGSLPGKRLARLVVGDPPREAPPQRPELLAGFAPVATLGVGLVLASAVVLAWRSLGSWSALLGAVEGSGWGRTLAAKAALAATAMGLGGWNFLRLRRSGPVPRRSVTAEVAVGLAVITATALLTSLPPAGTSH